MTSPSIRLIRFIFDFVALPAIPTSSTYDRRPEPPTFVIGKKRACSPISLPSVPCIFTVTLPGQSSLPFFFFRNAER
jgi:hypothetical protein